LPKPPGEENQTSNRGNKHPREGHFCKGIGLEETRETYARSKKRSVLARINLQGSRRGGRGGDVTLRGGRGLKIRDPLAKKQGVYSPEEILNQKRIEP